MTEQDLINSMQAAVTNATAVLSQLAAYGTGNSPVTITLAGGQSFTFNSIPMQQAAIASQLASDRTAFAANFGGTVSGMTLTRDSAGNIASTLVTLNNGYTISQVYTRSGQYNRITSIAVVVKDNTGLTQLTVTKTLTYDASNKLQSIS